MKFEILRYQNCCYLPLGFFNWPRNSNLPTELVLPWIYIAITEIRHLPSKLVQFNVHTIRY